MRRLTRYVLAELLTVFVISLVAFTLIGLIGGVIREAIQQNLPPGQIAALIPFLLPESLRITLPVALLLATTGVYARMAGSNEILAIKSLGISPTTFLWPAATLACLLSLVTVWLNDLAVSWGRTGAQQVVVDSVEEIAYSMLRTDKRYSSGHFSIVVKAVDGRRLIRPTISLQRGEGDHGMTTITADAAELRVNRDRNVLVVVVRNGRIETPGLGEFHDFGVREWEIPLKEASRAKRLGRHPSLIALRDIPEETAAIRKEIERYQRELAARAASATLSGNLDDLGGEEWRKDQRRLDYSWSLLYRLRTEPHRRWSAGFSCFCFVWVGGPMAIRRGHRDFLTSFFVCFLPILVVYYPLLMYGIDGAKSGAIPPVSLWGGNMLLFFWGAWLIRRVVRY